MTMRALLRAWAGAAALGASWGPVVAGNIDPAADGSRYAYAENAGWINAAPGGASGPGATVADFELTGWMWSENAGWISLSCKNTGGCPSNAWSVRNDGAGALSGLAWSENAGWIDFGPAGAGVFIDPATGNFAGRAWAENLGWISFASSGPNPFRVTTSWRCSPPPGPPAGTPSLGVARSTGAVTVSWSGPAGATGFDVISGGLDELREAGNVPGATERTLATKTPFTSLRDDGVPGPGEVVWYLSRGRNCGAAGTYNDGTQRGTRD